MEISIDRFKKILVDSGQVSFNDWTKIEKRVTAGESVRDIVLDMGILKPNEIDQIIADEIGYPYVSLSKKRIDEKVFSMIPEVMAKNSGVVAINTIGDRVVVGFVDPTEIETKNNVEKRLGHMVIPYLISPEDLKDVLERYKSSLKDEFNKLLKKVDDKSLPREEADEVIVRAVDLLISYGFNNKASDIHVEPFRKKAVIRFRIDGVMHDVLEIPKELLDPIVTRIKILSKMRTDEHRAAQDGKFRFTSKGEDLDIRVSSVPVVDGENVVMRLLSSQNRNYNLTDLGMNEGDRVKVEKAIKKPHGMVLVTGPTGSGKTTTVYALLKILNTREVHISTIEDPVEYDIEGVSQIQVDKKTNLTFAQGLRAIVRQDPDIIMVGEIRDEETAGIATNSAMTGHLVLSTLHANDAPTTLPRLLDMKIEPFLVASTVNVVVAQRLVRILCTVCRASKSLSKDEISTIESEVYLKEIFKDSGYNDLSKVTVFESSGCDVCHNTGYVGRTGIFEVLEIDEPIKSLISNRASSEEILQKAKEEGMSTMLQDGIEKVLNGVTTLDEVVRVTKS